MKRFCISCGFKQKKWQRATYFRGMKLPCVICRRVAHTNMEARKLDMCSECFKVRDSNPTESKSGSQRDDIRVGKTRGEPRVRDFSKDQDRVTLHDLGQACPQVLCDHSNFASETRSHRGMGTDPSDDRLLGICSDRTSSQRAERCVRCWMIDHTFERALVFSHSSERLCASCWMSRLHIDTTDKPTDGFAGTEREVSDT
jgi:hypothetical protein